jgi:TrmH family RNA methyltransferase
MDGSDFKDVEPSTKRILIFGNESNGVSDEVLSLESKKVSITRAKHSKAESLNIAVACGIFLSDYCG